MKAHLFDKVMYIATVLIIGMVFLKGWFVGFAHSDHIWSQASMEEGMIAERTFLKGLAKRIVVFGLLNCLLQK